MASAPQDSSPSLRFISLDGSGELGSGPEPQLPVIDFASDSPLPIFPDEPNLPGPPQSSAPPAEPQDTPANTDELTAAEAEAGVFVRGDVLMCSCPDCQAPITIRTWLMIADCWRCRVSIELDEQMEQEAERLLDKQRKKKARAPKQQKAKPAPKKAPAKEPVVASVAASPAKPKAEPRRPTPPPPPNGKSKTDPRREPAEAKKPARSTPPPPPKSAPLADTTDMPRQPSKRPAGPKLKDTPPSRSLTDRRRGPLVGARARIHNMSRKGTAAVVVSDWLSETPAWLVSLIVHLVLLTLLGLINVDRGEEAHFITLSMAAQPDVIEGGETTVTVAEEMSFDLPVPPDMDLSNPQVRDAMVKADQEARELRIDETADPPLPDIARVKDLVKRSGDVRATLAARDPRLRVEVVKKEGGTTLTEAAVARGLRWLAQEQESDGRWVLGRGHTSDSAATSLALMPFLGAGQTHLVGRYKNNVGKALQWLIKNQKPNGDLRANSSRNAGMYAHGQAAIVLCEAFLMTGDEELRAPAQKAIDFIVAAQYVDGGWRYQPKSEAGRAEKGDTSVAGWQIMALQSAKAANLTVDKAALEMAGHYLDRVQHNDGAEYSYQKGNQPTHVMTAEGLLCRVYMGWKKDNPSLGVGVKHLINNHKPSANQYDIYYFYYGTQLMHHYGGKPWEEWNQRMRDILVKYQLRNGRDAGSWPAKSRHTGGALYETCLSICTLEVYYRHLPIFRQIDVE